MVVFVVAAIVVAVVYITPKDFYDICHKHENVSF
jgi:hypothetical protein